MHSFAFARLAKYVMTIAELLSAFGIEDEQIHMMLSLPCLAQLGVTV